MAPRIPRLICGVLLTSQMMAGCTSWQVVPVSPRALVDSAHAKAIKVSEKGGARYVLDAPAVVGDSLTGTVLKQSRGDRFASRVAHGVLLAEVDHVAVRKESISGTLFAVLAVAVAFVVAAMSSFGTIGFQ